MDKHKEGGTPPRRADRTALRRSVRHPYITRQHPAGEPEDGDGPARADRQPDEEAGQEGV